MMTRQGLVVVAAASLLVAGVVGSVSADVRRTQPERRPYITEVGEPYSVGLPTVDREAAKINQLRDYINAYGYPDYAEIQEIQPEWPWESYEVRLYYMRRDIETDFGHVFCSPAMENLGVLKYIGAIPPDKRHEIDVILQARLAPPAPPPPAAIAAAPPPSAPQPQASGGVTEAVVARLEAAAERASQAADKAVDASDAAGRAADRTVNILEKLQAPAPATAPKRRNRSR